MSTGIKGTAATKLHRDLGIANASASRFANRIREEWLDQEPTFAGPSNAEEKFNRGEEAIKRSGKKVRAARGNVVKVEAASSRDRESGKGSPAVGLDTREAAVQPLFWSCVLPDAKIAS